MDKKVKTVQTVKTITTVAKDYEISADVLRKLLDLPPEARLFVRIPGDWDWSNEGLDLNEAPLRAHVETTVTDLRTVPQVGSPLEVFYEGVWVLGTIIEEEDATWRVEISSCVAVQPPEAPPVIWTVWKANSSSWRVVK